ncbi:hypothetical protein NQ315_009312 [Exocentrus adspersus]|uniref:Uncharacterized protein n=1 Tax=Exocentrus adspersus TaxID=1586481 RepID=A0AAV8WFX8_9CUCU|nr:hypothetical protein NQ315_009312 [Exocentrus adspersus]
MGTVFNLALCACASTLLTTKQRLIRLWKATMASSQPSQGCSQEREKEPMINSAGIKQKHIVSTLYTCLPISLLLTIISHIKIVIRKKNR